MTVTGLYDHPAAEACLFSNYDVSDEPTLFCRMQFAVTSVEH